jgi:diacylglycerol kinase (ATP)
MNPVEEARSLLRKARWSWEGFTAAFRSEKAVRQECLVLVGSILLAMFVPMSPAELILVLILPLLMIAVELLNTALEEVINHISPDIHPMAKKAKDCGSAAVALVAIALALTWGVILLT